MKRTAFVSLILLTVLCGGLVAANSGRSGAGSNKADGTATNSAAAAVPAPPPQQQEQPTGTANYIDGAKTPELIPDHVAYSLFFRFLAGRPSEEEKRRAKAYLRSNVFGATSCPGTSAATVTPPDYEAKINTLLEIAEEYHKGASELDAQAEGLKMKLPDPGVTVALRSLQGRKEALALAAAASLPVRLGANGSELVRKFVNEQFKRRVRIHAPRTGGEGSPV